jgi:hypothetical protein
VRFDIQNSNGKAGEYYFAYWICSYFGWPCRLLDIDIGIDAQLEIFDDKKHSTGEFICVQIKTSQEDKRKITTSIANLEYWKSITDPVIIVAVSNIRNTPKMHWRLMSDEFIDSLIEKVNKREAENFPLKDKHSLEISFTISKEEKLSTDDLDTFRNLPYREILQNCDDIFKKIEKIHSEIAMAFWCSHEKEYDIHHLTKNLPIEKAAAYLAKFEKYFIAEDEINNLLDSNPKAKVKFLKYPSKFRVFLLNKLEQLISYIHLIDSDYDNVFFNYWTKSERHKILSSHFEKEYKKGKQE